MQNKVVILGTGGTIAGVAADAGNELRYRSASLGVEQLVAAVPALQSVPLEVEQVAQVDSKDMTHAIWQTLAQRAEQHLRRVDVAGVVITHGTDTMEETAYFLHRVLAPARPLVLTGAMRPANARNADGPRNLADAVALAADEAVGAHGVLVVMQGAVHGAADVRKLHPHRIDHAFSSGDVGPVARIDAGRVQRLRAWPTAAALGLALVECAVDGWPAVEIVTSHAGANGMLIDALARSGARGVVIACTGNGTLHESIEQALERAAWGGLRVLRATRCGEGAILDPEGVQPNWPSAGALTPAKARVELMLSLMTEAHQAARP
jgi:L-asparaginase